MGVTTVQGASIGRSLLEGAKAGDPAALELVLQQVWPHLWRLAFSILKDAALAEDAAQEASVQIVRALPRLRNPDAFDVWIARIVSRMAFRMPRRKTVPLCEAALCAAPASMDHQAEAMDVASAMASLTPRQRATLYLASQGYTSAEIGRGLGLAAGSVRFILFQARSHLKKLLADPAADISSFSNGLVRVP